MQKNKYKKWEKNSSVPQNADIDIKQKTYLSTNGKFGTICAESKTLLWSNRFQRWGISWNNANGELFKNQFE
jgi:hypothetical protein